MRNFDETTITNAVLDRLSGASDPRTAQISASMIRHLHAFMREVRPTIEEWERGIAFLTATGKMCSDSRQEFVLLSDTLGVSMLVDAINHGAGEGVTESTVLGPFYVESPPAKSAGEDISVGINGEPLIVTGSVLAPDGAPIRGATVDVWHSDGDGYYDVQQLEATGLAMRARFTTDDDGNFRFWTIKPAAYPIPHDGTVGAMLEKQGRHPWRPAHVHFMISAEGYQKLVTHVFAEGDQYLDSDVVFGVKDSLVRKFVEYQPGTAPDGLVRNSPYFHLHYDFGLQRART
jgi:hydroxyquinol 1,2-dioxygenase